MTKVLKKILKFICILIGIVVLSVIIYASYVVISYHRIEDKTNCEIVNNNDAIVDVNKEYTIVTYNIGFGAYCQDYTFFMDGGKESRARSKDSVIDLVTGAGDLVKSFDPDFVLFQEVDINSTRSYHVNQIDLLAGIFKDYNYTYAINYDSAYLPVPPIKPHGKSKSSLCVFSKEKIDSSLRRSLPISTSFSKFLDLDRCYDVVRFSLGDKDLVIYNAHLSAYGGTDEIRTGQMTMLFEDMQQEFDKGNYCICGGDFNHDFTGISTQDLNGGATVDFGWAQPFPIDLLNNYTGLKRQIGYNEGLIKPTCRNCDEPYEIGNFTIIVDGFITTTNITVTSLENIVTDFVYSDHNPVVLKFKLN